MSVIINGDTGITTPAETVQGALTTTGNTILGDASTDTLTVGVTGIVKDASGNVGIGTASPVSLLDVRDSTGSVVTLGKTSSFSASQTSRIKWQEGSTQLADIGWESNGNEVRINNRIAGPTSFYTSNTERMRIDSSGNLLVGTTSRASTEKFALAGNMYGTFDGSAVNGINLKTTWASTGSGFIYFYNSGSTVCGTITQNGSTTVSYATSSDYRLKNTIAPMQGALATVAQLKPCTYTWKADGSDGQGFIAHELQAVVPDCVTGEKDAVDAEGKPQYQGIDTSFLVATLTAAIQELKAIVDAQAVRIAALES